MQNTTSTPEFIFPDVKVNVYKPNNPVLVPITENRIATFQSSPNIIRHIAFDVSGTELENVVQSGQSIGIVPDVIDHESGRPAKVRLYSICSPTGGEDGKGKIIATTVKRVIEEHPETQDLFLGLCSNYLSSLKPGDVVKMTGPNGKKFVLPQNTNDFNYVFFATGTGVAPFRAMWLELLEKQVQSQVAMIFGTPYRTDLLYHELFEESSIENDNFHYLYSISREGLRPDGSRNHVQYQITDSKDQLGSILSAPNTLIYVCGIKGMELGIYRQLALEGYTEYMRIDEEIAQKPATEWSYDDLKKKVRSSSRLFLEVY